MLLRIRRSMEDRDEGFTLIELLVVVIIIGILAAIAIPIFLNQRKSAVDAGVESDIRNLATNIETYATQNAGTYPTADNNATTGIRFASPVITVGANLTQNISNTSTVIKYGLNGTTGFYLCGYNSAAGNTSATSAFIYSSQGGGIQAAKNNCNATAPGGTMYAVAN